MIKKVYSTTESSFIYVNNEKVIISEQAAAILNFDNDPFDGSISTKVLSYLINATESKNAFTEPKDLDIVATAEKCRIKSFDKEINGFNFKGWFIFKEGICIGMKIERNGRLLNVPGSPEDGYKKVKSQLDL